MKIKGTVTISLEDYVDLQKAMKEMRQHIERLENIIKLPEVVKVLHQENENDKT